MKLTKAVLFGSNVHLRCECMGEEADTVYSLVGYDKGEEPRPTAETLIERAVLEFALLHDHNAPVPEEVLLPFAGQDLSSIIRGR